MNKPRPWYLFPAAFLYVILLGCETTTASPAPATSASASAVQDKSVGYLTINRLPNLGGAVGIFISIDGVSVARIGYGESYHGTLAPGEHLISITRYPHYMVVGPTEKRLRVQSGQSYLLTVKWKDDLLVLM